MCAESRTAGTTSTPSALICGLGAIRSVQTTDSQSCEVRKGLTAKTFDSSASLSLNCEY